MQSPIRETFLRKIAVSAGASENVRSKAKRWSVWGRVDSGGLIKGSVFRREGWKTVAHRLGGRAEGETRRSWSGKQAPWDIKRTHRAQHRRCTATTAPRMRQKKRQSKEVMTQRGRLKKSEEDEEKKEQRKVTNTATVFTSERLLAFLQCPLFDMTGSERWYWKALLHNRRSN